MKKIIIAPLLLVSVLLMLSACGKESSFGGTDRDISSDVAFGKDDYKKIISGNNELGFKLLAEVKPDENDNLFISPTSLLAALSMIYNGADGVTKEEIAKTLQVEGIDVADLNKANASMMSKLHKDSDQIQLNVTNSIWLNDNYKFQDEFSENNQDYFNAEVKEIDILNKDAAKEINDWVKASTNDKIKEIVKSPLNSDLVAILINAIYFKGDWTYEFDKKLTEDRAFYLQDGTTKDVPLMTLNENIAYLENENFQAVTLPYGEEEMSMKVFLPKENTNLEQFKKLLTNENWTAWNAAFQQKEGNIMLPKFQLEYETLLNDALQSLGMQSAFNESAEFTKMIKEDGAIWISEVKQKTFMDVNEEGTEAAAATSITVVETSAPMDEPFNMEVNRPFFIAITDDETGAVLFMGTISNPLQGE